MEVWKDIVGYEGLYQISNYGNVKSLKRKVSNSGSFGDTITIKEKILKNRKRSTKYGYESYSVMLCKNGVNKSFLVHRLVAEHFLQNTNNLPIINHKDEDPLNNHVDNLEWCDYKYNTNYGNCQNKRISTKRLNTIQKYLNGYFEQHPTRRCNFKSICKKYNLNVNDFQEIYSGELYKEIRKNGDIYYHKKYMYKYIGKENYVY